MAQHYLQRFFNPRAIAVVGASEAPDSVGMRVLSNIRDAGYRGELYPVNPKHERVLGLRCHHSVAEIPGPVDLAVISTPAETVPGVVHECGEKGIRSVIVHSSGIGRDSGLERRLLDEVRHYSMHLIGPNCLGVMRPASRLNATFGRNSGRPGRLALVSQSGALITAILDWAQGRNVGFSIAASLGNAADVDFGDVLDYLATDPDTDSILLYLEGIRNNRRFMSGLRAAARVKPVIVVKAGRYADSAQAAVSHAGALVGSDDVFDAALARAGAIRVDSVEQLFSAAQLLSSRQRLEGNRLGIVTNGGGPGVIATDRATEMAMQVPPLATDSVKRLDSALPKQWSHANPVDILEDATPERYRAALETCLEDDSIDAVIAILVPQAMTDPEAIARVVIEAAEGKRKPVAACWMGDTQVREARELFVSAGLPHFDTPESAVEAFAYLARYQENQKLLFQVPGPSVFHDDQDVEGSRLIVENALAEGRKLLGTLESRALLRAFDIPVNTALEARSPGEALVAAESVGFPVAMKISSPHITHKRDVDGVRLDVRDARSVRGAYTEIIEAVRQAAPDAELRGVTVEPMRGGAHARELIVGVTRDSVFGPVVTFGSGGSMTEILRDRAVALPPLNTFIASDLIRRTRISRLLERQRNMPPANLEAVREVLLQVSNLVCSLPHVREMDINPLMVDENGAVAVDARFAIEHPPSSPDRYGHLAIHPYPAHLVSRHQLPDGTDVTIRPIRPEDAEIEQAFVSNLSAEAKYFRFMETLERLSPAMLARFTQIDYDREMALIAVRHDGDREEEIGVARYTMDPDEEGCEFALVVSDRERRRGLGSRLMHALMESARAKGLSRMHGEVLATNSNMLRLMRHLGFTSTTDEDDPGIRRVAVQL